MPSLRTAAVAAVVALGAVGTALVVIDRDGVPSLLNTPYCTVVADGHTVEVDFEQMENASLITAISIRRGMPARAASIALATAYQESKLHNIDYGDRDSVGLFQQRPSQGWGEVDQLMDPVYSTNAFFDALEQVEGYETMEITVAAQEVQRSAFPDAYADHELDGRALASALTGNSPGALSCDIPGDAEEVNDTIDDTGLVPRATAVRRDLEARFGTLSLGGFQPGGVTDGHMEGSAHYEGRAIDVFYRPINPENKKRGWAMAAYLVANADRLHVKTVIFDNQIWTARRGDQGWRAYDPDTAGRTPEVAAVLEHRDHVHVDVYE